MQSFHARGEYLDSLEIRMEGGAPVLVRLLPSEEGAAALFEKVVTAPDSMDLVTIEPDAPVMLTPGMPYVVEIQTTGTSAIVGLGTTAGDVYRYGFGWARLGTSEGDYLENDFSMRVRGRRTTPLPADPTKRALLIVVENGGFGSSLEAAPIVYIDDADLHSVITGQNMADICITSQIDMRHEAAPADAFKLDDVAGVGVVPGLAQGQKCQRSWKILPEVGSVDGYPDLSPRDAAAVAEYDARA